MISESEESAANMSIQTVTPSTASADEVNNTNYVNKSCLEPMAEVSKLEKNHGDEVVRTNIIRFCAFVVAKPKLSFDKIKAIVRGEMSELILTKMSTKTKLNYLEMGRKPRILKACISRSGKMASFINYDTLQVAVRRITWQIKCDVIPERLRLMKWGYKV